MYLRLVSRRLQPGHWDDFERYYEERYMPGTHDTKGLGRRQLLRSTEDSDEAMTISFWDSQDDLLAYERSPVRRALAQGLEEFYPALAYPMGDYWVKHFEVVDKSTY